MNIVYNIYCSIQFNDMTFHLKSLQEKKKKNFCVTIAHTFSRNEPMSSPSFTFNITICCNISFNFIRDNLTQIVLWILPLFSGAHQKQKKKTDLYPILSKSSSANIIQFYSAFHYFIFSQSISFFHYYISQTNFNYKQIFMKWLRYEIKMR